jgi:phage terminase large subunit
MMEQEVTVDLTSLYDPRRNVRQMEFHAALEMFKLYGGAMGGGKTAAIINEGIQLSLDYPGNLGLLMRKTLPSFRDTVLPQLERFLPEELFEDWNQSEKIITFINKSRIRYGGLGDGPNDWQKFMGGEYGWIGLDQAEEFTEKEFLMLATRLRLKLPNIRRHLILTCNPDPGWLKERFIEKNLPDHIFIPALPTDNLGNLPDDYIQKMESVLDENQRKALLRGDWEAVGAPDNVYSYLWLKAAMTRKEDPGDPVEIGVDVARDGDDETVIVEREGLRVSVADTDQGVDLMKTTGKIWKLIVDKILPARKYQLFGITIKVDADGLGAGVVDRLKETKSDKEEEISEKILKVAGKEAAARMRANGFRFRIRIIEIHGSAKASDPARFKNLRAEIHWSLREVLDVISLPDDRELLSQLMAIKYRVNSAGQIEIIPKDEIKKKLGRSPDRAEGVLYSLADIKPAGTAPRIRRLN